MLTPKQIRRIRDILKRHFNSLIYGVLGGDKLSESDKLELESLGWVDDNSISSKLFQDAYLVGKIRNSANEFQTRETYKEWKTNLNLDDELTKEDLESIDLVEESASHYIQNLRDKTINNVMNTILENNKQQILGDLGSPTSNKLVDIEKLTGELRNSLQGVFKDWKKIVITELSKAHSQGSVKSILEDNPGKTADEVNVYCIGPLDDGTCEWCRKFYHDGKSFKIYKLSELINNGNNIGRKTRDWKPCLPPMHPFCRHRLVELMPGWRLDENGKANYVGLEAVEKSLQGKVPTFTGRHIAEQYQWQGMKISIENKAGTYRNHRTAEDREHKDPKENYMYYDYGYINNTLDEGDGMQFDCFINKLDKYDKYAYVVREQDRDTKEYVQDKIFLGFESKKAAKKAYLLHFRKKTFRKVFCVTIDRLKEQILGKEVYKIKKSITFKKSLEGTTTFSGWKLQDQYRFQDMEVSIENKKGSKRHWEDRAGRSGDTEMCHDYGYIKRTKGADGEQIDCYVGPNEDAKFVYVIHQIVPSTGSYDEDKCMLGFDSAKEAKEEYLKHYDRPDFFGSMDIFGVEEFRDKVIGKEVRLIKSGMSVKAGHKYIKRTSTPGNYKYWYKLPNGKLYSGDNAPAEHPDYDPNKNNVKKVVVKTHPQDKGHKFVKTDEKTGLHVYKNSKNVDYKSTQPPKETVSKLPLRNSSFKVANIKSPKEQALDDILEGKKSEKKDIEYNIRNAPGELKSALEYWSEDGYRYIRNLQKGETVDRPDIEEDPIYRNEALNHLRVLDKYFHKLPKYYNKPIIRALDIPDPAKLKTTLSLMKPNEIYSIDAYSSFSEGFKPLGDWTDTNLRLVVKNNRSGRNINDFNPHGEGEILVPKGTKYRILEHKEKDGIHTIYMEEVDE